MRLRINVEPEHLALNKDQRCTIAENLRHLMRLRKTTESKIAQELNVPVMTIRRLLSGETTDPRVFTLKTLANYFNVTIDTLIETGLLAKNQPISQSKPLFIPVLDWEAAKNIDAIDLKNWQTWIPVTIGKGDNISASSFALESRPSMYPRFQHGTIFIFDPVLIPTDGDLVLVHLFENNELTLRELFVDPPEWQFHPVNQGSSILNYDKEAHIIMAVVFLTLFYNRKLGPINTEV